VPSEYSAGCWIGKAERGLEGRGGGETACARKRTKKKADEEVAGPFNLERLKEGNNNRKIWANDVR